MSTEHITIKSANENLKWERIIEVDKDFFEKLESYLQADERFTSVLHIASLIFYTVDSKRIIFKEKK